MKIHKTGRRTEEGAATASDNQRRGRVGSKEDNK